MEINVTEIAPALIHDLWVAVVQMQSRPGFSGQARRATSLAA
jgi:hypothetical protein